MSDKSTSKTIRIIKILTGERAICACVGKSPQNDGCIPKGFQRNHTLLHMFNYHLLAFEVESHNGVNVMHVNSVCICALNNIQLAANAVSPLLQMQINERHAGRCNFQDCSHLI